jgi:thymidylate kinase
MRLSESRVFKPHQEVGRLVVVEGDPGAGKSAAIASVSRNTNIVVVPQLDHVTDALRPFPFDSNYPEDWYVEAERARQSEIRRLLELGHLVLQDRCVLSTIAFVYASTFRHHRPARVRRLLQRLDTGQKVIRPDVLVIMHVDVEVGLRRRRTFRESEQYRIWFDQDFLTRYQAFYRVLAPRVLRCRTAVIDTTSLSCKAVVEALVNSYLNLDRR